MMIRHLTTLLSCNYTSNKQDWEREEKGLGDVIVQGGRRELLK